MTCPLCGWSGRSFEPVGHLQRPNARCAGCGALERHRALVLYLRNQTAIFTEPTRLLHFAPEPGLRRIFERHDSIDYITTDLNMPDVTMRMSIDDLLFRDDLFDCVICSHVLEHVPDDYAAMGEIRRVLRPDGFAVLMVPILNPPGGRTLEDPAIVTPEERERVYGQDDHLRKYGPDFPERARAVGFEVTVVDYPALLGAEAIRTYALNPKEHLYICRP